MRRPLLIFVIFALVFTLLLDTSDARRRRRRSRNPKEPAEKILYERMGGRTVIKDVAEGVLTAVQEESSLPATLGVATGPKGITVLRGQLNEWLCVLADGPCNRGKTVVELFPNLKTDDAAFYQFAGAVLGSLTKVGVKEREKNEVMARLGEDRIGDDRPSSP